ncbi:nuclease-related domain-containing protein [Macrococcus equipercicus]|uniref:NERD domain-containing protein n=1 Tax=Macrococcus equipercicus TaxID=69967 RepID=A0A9Q9BUT4_9STAP|nr:nuclease-related domain-containing protein [Macrococcus equipercicus]KAA1036595.1 NERD domain-containing protein [Macrococcus equipercicus]UTH13472.1 NERD domain-containing protein [Macrococcus equipercicus]
MLLKSCDVPYRLKYYDALVGRVKMTDKQSKDYAIYQSGYQGEWSFAELIKAYKHAVVLWDVSLNNRCGEAQFDFIVIHDYVVTHYDVKNFKGSYQLQGNMFVSRTGSKIKNPDTQLAVAHAVLESEIKSYDWRYEVESYIVFINETFHLDGSKKEQWLYKSQLKHHLSAIDNPHPMTEHNMQLGNHLLQRHQPNPHLNMPVKTEFSSIAGGLKCPLCRKRIEILLTGKKYYNCPACMRVFMRKEILLRSLQDLYYLQEVPFSISEAEEWCQLSSRTTLKRLLREYFKSTGQKKSVKYYL